MTLESFTKEQRKNFLKFMWGRTRLPLTEQDWGEQKMRIHTLDTRSPDTHFPGGTRRARADDPAPVCV